MSTKRISRLAHAAEDHKNFEDELIRTHAPKAIMVEFKHTRDKLYIALENPTEDNVQAATSAASVFQTQLTIAGIKNASGGWRISQHSNERAADVQKWLNANKDLTRGWQARLCRAMAWDCKPDSAKRYIARHGLLETKKKV